MNTQLLFKRHVLMSIRPEYIAKILGGEKRVELRRRFPEAGVIGATAYLYASSPVQAVVARARMANVRKMRVSQIWKEYGDVAGVSKDEFRNYFSGLEVGFAIVLEEVQSLQRELRARELWDDYQIAPPQSYRYLYEAHSLFEDERIQITHRHKRRNRT